MPECPKCGEPMLFIKNWYMQAKSRRGPLLKISLYKCPGCGATKRETEKVKEH